MVYDLYPILDREGRMPAKVREEMIDGTLKLTTACQVEAIFISIVINATLFTTGLIGYDRYRTVCTPMKKLKRNHAVIMWVGIILYGLILSLINLVFVGTNTSAGFNLYCSPNFSDMGTLLLLIVCGFIPALGSNLYFYGRVAYELYKIFQIRRKGEGKTEEEMTPMEKKNMKQ